MSDSDNISNNHITESLLKFKRRYYLNLTLKGAIYSSLFIITSFVIINTLEYYFYFNTTVRAIFFFSFLAIAFTSIYWFVLKHLVCYFLESKQMSDEKAALLIGAHFPEINDKLLNTIQLNQLSKQAGSELVWAGIKQKTVDVIRFPFFKAINFSENKKYLKYLYVPTAILIILAFFVPNWFSQGTTRIVNFNTKYEKAKPFAFLLENTNLVVFKNEDIDILLSTPGLEIDEISLVKGNIPLKMKKQKDGKHRIVLQNINTNDKFYFSGLGYDSETYEIKVVKRPSIQNYSILLDYPKYLNKENEVIKNVGNINVPEGTKITWNINANSDSILFYFEDNVMVAKAESDMFKNHKTATQSESYKIALKNEFGSNKEPIINYIDVIKDQFPTIKVEEYFDTLTYSNVYFTGKISDDYGFTSLQFNYRIVEENKNTAFEKKTILIEKNKQEQLFNHNHAFDNIKAGQKIEYYLSVSDNDGINGPKTAKTGTFTLSVPDKKNLEAEIEKKSDNIEKSLSDLLKETKKNKQETKKVNDKLKSKNNINWNENKQIEDLLQKHKQMNDALENLKEQYNNLNKQKDKFNQVNESLKEKHELLQKLMNDVLDDETKKLMQELEKLLNEKKDADELKNSLDELNKKDLNVEKQLERAIELFKQLKVEEKLDKTIDNLNKLAEKQEELSKKTDDSNKNKEDKKANQEELANKQEKLNEEFEEIKKEIDELNELNNELENKQNLEDTEQEEKDIEKDQKDSQEQLNKGDNKKASKSQKSAADKMKELSKKMQKNKNDMDAEAIEQNIEDLRNLLENLVKLSFDQEEVMKDFRTTNQVDPKFIALSQKQLKIKDDSKIIEDSLYALAKRIIQMESFVTKELNEMNSHIDKSVELIKQRRTPQAGVSQQFAMSSMNNLALLLSDVLKQLQSEAESQSSGEGSCNKPGMKKPGKGKPKAGDLSKMQKGLNDKISQLKQSGKQGKQLSEELAKLAAEQEMLRNALKELEKMGKEQDGEGKDGKKEGGNGGMGDKISELKKQMEETEKDLYNKRISPETILRQQEILTRLLEAEKAVRERELDPKREAKTGKDFENKFPPRFEEYLKNKEKQLELIKTVSPEYRPYYKSETNKYFEKLSNN
jgi:hypothetical protein